MSDIGFNDIIVIGIRAIFMLVITLLFVPLLVLLERKICGYIQDRPGPNRTNIKGIRLGGLIQSMADFLKLVVKEEFYSSSIIHTVFYKLAPFLIFFTVLLSCATIPFSSNLTIDTKTYVMSAIPSDVGILWYLGFSSISVYSVLLAGYSSDSKYSLLSAVRAGSQSISYEIPMGLAIVSMILTYSTTNLDTIVSYQDNIMGYVLPRWGIFMQPLAFIIFVVTAFAETNRAPFDIVEGESEIVGYHAEYGAMRFALFFLSEYAAMVIASSIIVVLFFGGYSIPYISTDVIVSNYKDLLFGIILIVLISSFMFYKWLKANNKLHFKIKNDMRVKENVFYNILNLIFTFLIVSLLFFILLNEISSTALNIFVVVIHSIVFLIKVFIMLFIFIWVRWTLPRFRYDQLQRLCWEKLLPLSLLNIVITAIIKVL